jgi:hypothetical protein
MAEYLTAHLTEMGMRAEGQEVFPGRPNRTAHGPGQGTGKRVDFSQVHGYNPAVLAFT